jgi:hypothetical protein
MMVSAYNYVLALRGNQGTLLYGASRILDDPECEVSAVEITVDADHGRIETRAATVAAKIDWLQEDHQWPGLAAIGKVVRTWEIAGTTSTETANYLQSTLLSGKRLNEVVRSRWGVENRCTGASMAP